MRFVLTSYGENDRYSGKCTSARRPGSTRVSSTPTTSWSSRYKLLKVPVNGLFVPSATSPPRLRRSGSPWLTSSSRLSRVSFRSQKRPQLTLPLSQSEHEEDAAAERPETYRPLSRSIATTSKCKSRVRRE